MASIEWKSRPCCAFIIMPMPHLSFSGSSPFIRVDVMTLPVSQVIGEVANQRHVLRPGIGLLIHQAPGKSPGTHISIFEQTQAETTMVIIVYARILKALDHGIQSNWDVGGNPESDISPQSIPRDFDDLAPSRPRSFMLNRINLRSKLSADSSILCACANASCLLEESAIHHL